MPHNITVVWSDQAKGNLRNIYNNLLYKNSAETAKKIRAEIFSAPHTIVFPEQFQYDDYLTEFRRIIIRNYKILYYANGPEITIISVFNTHRHPSNMKG
jgi:plasmid stabilization system protein ParE